MINAKQERIKEKIEWIKEELKMMTIVRPGSLSKQYNVCGKLGCACKDKENPKKHGPYHVLSFRHQGKNRTEFIRNQFVGNIKEWTGDYRKLWKLIEKWAGLSIELSKLQMKEAEILRPKNARRRS